jgi:hypothetical protein
MIKPFNVKSDEDAKDTMRPRAAYAIICGSGLRLFVCVVTLLFNSITTVADDRIVELHEWLCARPASLVSRTPQQRSALEFEQMVSERLKAVYRNATELRVSLNVPEIDYGHQHTMRQRSYRNGSLSPRARDAYQEEVVAIVTDLENQISTIQQVRLEQWRRDNPVEARIMDAEAAAELARAEAAEANRRASDAEAAANIQMINQNRDRRELNRRITDFEETRPWWGF